MKSAPILILSLVAMVEMTRGGWFSEFDPFLLRLQSVQFSIILVTQFDIESMVHEIFYLVF
jgi:hypothetical protein